MKTIIGIDLGTTNSEVTVIKEGKPTVVADAEGKRIIPSVVGRAGGEMLVGELARNQYAIDPENTVKSIKRKMGSSDKVKLGKESYTPQEISAFILKKLKAMAEKSIGHAISQAVITVPAYFTDKQRQATKDAGEIAGLEVMRIINEPTAAALAYGLDREDDQYLIVYDLGGGTFDVSVIEINSGVVEVLASHGNSKLGGDDFDAALVQYIAEQFLQEHGIDLREDRKAIARLTLATERAKIELSNAPFTWIKEEFIATKDSKPLHLQMEIERTVFESLIKDMLTSTMECVEQALEDAELQREKIDKVLLVGGSTRMPLITEMIESSFSLQPRLEIDPDLCVAMGAGVQAGIIAGEPIDTVLVDVTPHSLGIEVAGLHLGHIEFDRYSVLIRRNTPIPVSKSEVYTTLTEHQREAEIKVYQGENHIASKNTLLGEFMLQGLQKSKKGIPEIIVNFDYDINGIVQVSAEDKKTGEQKNISVVASEETLTKEQKQQASERIADTEIVVDKAPSTKDISILRNRALQILNSLTDDKAKTELQELLLALDTAVLHEDESVAELQEQLLDLLYEFEE